VKRDSGIRKLKVAHHLILSFLLPIVASAGTITFTDTGGMVTFMAVTPDLPGRVTGSCIGESCTLTVGAPANTSSGTSSIVQVFLEPGGGISDIFCGGLGMQTCAFPNNNNNPTMFTLTFGSDTGAGFPGSCTPSPTCVVETGMLQTAGTISWQTSTVIITDTIQFTSAEETASVPEPSSAPLMLAGITMLAMAYLCRRISSRTAGDVLLR
jgi:hypothetical protein